MRRSNHGPRLLVASLLFAAAVYTPRPAGAEVVRQLAGNVSLGSRVVVSGNGRFVLRHEPSGGDVCGTPRNGTVVDVVVYDLETSRGECVTVDPDGRGIFGPHDSASISADGQLVVFSSNVDGLDPRCDHVLSPRHPGHVYLRNRLTRHTECISVTEAGVPGNGTGAMISANGGLIAFWTSDPNLIEGGFGLVVVKLVGGVRQGPAVLAIPREFRNGGVPAYTLSGDGRFVAFVASTLDAGAVVHAFRRNLESGEVVPMDLSAAGELANTRMDYKIALSADGRFGVFQSPANNLIPGITANPGPQLYRRDFETGEVVLVSRGLAGLPANAYFPSTQPPLTISADGRFVLFSSDATNLVANDTNGTTDLFVADLSTGISRITRLSVATDGVTEANGPSTSGGASALMAGSPRSTAMPPTWTLTVQGQDFFWPASPRSSKPC